MAPRILCVAEKPSIAKAVAEHLSGGRFNTRNGGSVYNKNYEFDFSFNAPWGECSVTMTSVSGHMMGLEFPPQYKSWQNTPILELFDGRVIEQVDEGKKGIADNITQQARYARALFIWTDCDREGEHIGAEIRQAAFKGKASLEVKRARFSNTERAHVRQAALNPVALDEHQVNAVATRQELDLRIGAAMTRFQTLNFRNINPKFEGKTISYGSCQFPTLGFIVDRYLRVQSFKPEEFWSISVMHTRENINVKFLWDRNHLFDRAVTTILFEQCLTAKYATITRLQTKPTSKWKPLPLTTVELQKLGSMFLRMDSGRVMAVAETLYQKGFISYPRTETDQFDRGMDLKKIVEKQIPSDNWGQYAQGLLNGGFRQPRSGRNNDQAHPPIHPVNYCAPSVLNHDEARVYEFVVRRFLGACSEDAKGETTTVNMKYGPETFHATGLLVLQRNYLEVYTYDKWQSSQQLPRFTVNERFEPTEANMTTGKTTAPGYITEPELIALMDANGIGTDATIADHITKVQDRDYVGTRHRGSVKEFIPSRLGVALIEGYENVGLETSLGKPFLRKEMELKMKAICDGRTTKREVVEETIEQYREMYLLASQKVEVLRRVVKRLVVDEAPDEDVVMQDVDAEPVNGGNRPARGRGSRGGATSTRARGGQAGRGGSRARGRGRGRGNTRARGGRGGG